MISFICIGPQRTASSWLDKRLRQHHEIALPQLVKETFFWDQRYSKGHDWYYQHFPTDRDYKVLGEIAPTCFDDIQAIQKIVADNPSIKVLICLRDPIERTYSLFCHYYATGRIKGSFSDALKHNERLIESSKYSKYVPIWEQNAGQDNVLIIKQEGVKQNPMLVLNEVCEFIGVNPIQWKATEEKYGQKVMPKSILITSFLSNLGRAFRYFGFHSIPELAKKIGVKKALYEGGTNKYPPLLESDRSRLLDEFALEYQWINNLPAKDTFLLSEVEIN